jgi:hypothetical protein
MTEKFDLSKNILIDKKYVDKNLLINDKDTLKNIISKLNIYNYSIDNYDLVRKNRYGFVKKILTSEEPKYILLYQNPKDLKKFVTNTDSEIEETKDLELEGFLPKVKKPKIEETKPKIEESKPKPIIETLPKLLVTKPKIEETKPKIEETKPKIEETKPKIEEPKPKIETLPKLLVTLPKLLETKPKIETLPKLLVTKPKIEETKPKIEETKKIEQVKSIFQIIKESLGNLGIRDLELNDDRSITNYYKKIVLNKDSWLDKVGVFKFNVIDNSYEFKMKNVDGTLKSHNFKIISELSKGSYNKVMLVKDQTNKTFILKSTIVGDDISQKMAFVENVKHAILYILIRNGLGNIKFIPQPFYIGICSKSESKLEILMIMEAGGKESTVFFGSADQDKINKLIWSIFNAYYLIETKLKINFKHCDFKYNNLLISSEGKPMIIDFGLTKFTISEGTKKINFLPINGGEYFQFSNPELPMLNCIHDLMHLFSSLYFLSSRTNRNFNPWKLINFIKNKDSFILDSNTLISYMEKCFREYIKSINDQKIIIIKNCLSKNLGGLSGVELEKVREFYLFFYDVLFFNFENDIAQGLITKDKLIITPEKLAENLGITVLTDDQAYDKFIKKYLKYKNKYITLEKIKYV